MTYNNLERKEDIRRALITKQKEINKKLDNE